LSERFLLASFSAAPPIAPDEGTGHIFGRLWLWGALFFGYISFGQAKESNSPAEAKNKVVMYYRQTSKHFNHIYIEKSRAYTRLFSKGASTYWKA
jgi:hypothetical protein